MKLHRPAAILLLLLFALTLPAHAKLLQEIIKIPMTVANAYGKEDTRDVVVTVFVDNATPAPRPILILGHGRAPEAEKRTTMGRQTFITNATWFSKMGFLVAVPTRIGYGVTGGDDLEDTGTCSRKNYPPGYAAAATQTLKVLDAMRQRSDTPKTAPSSWANLLAAPPPSPWPPKTQWVCKPPSTLLVAAVATPKPCRKTPAANRP